MMIKHLVIGLLITSQIAYGQDGNWVDLSTEALPNTPVIRVQAPTVSENMALQQLILTQKELDKQKFERDIAVREMNWMKEEEKGRWSGLTWFIIGVAATSAAASAVYFGTRR